MFAFPRPDGRGALTVGGSVALADLAEQHGTPLYVYNAGALRTRYRAITSALREAGFAVGHDGTGTHDHDGSERAGPPPPEQLRAEVCYSVKANSSLALLRILKEEGAGFDIVSGGELVRTQRAGVEPGRVVFAGIGKTDAEIKAAIAAGVRCFNVESTDELDAIEREAKRAGAPANGGGVPVALRLNPDVDPDTHTYITTGKRENKFGIDVAAAERALEHWADAWPHLALVGAHAHIGSQITAAAPYLDALDRVLPFLDRARERGHPVASINLGGGFALDYEAAGADDASDAEWPVDLAAYALAVAERLRGRGLMLLVEPGRSIVGPCAVLLARVLRVKASGDKTFAIVDAAMNDLLRPSLYRAFHAVVPVAALDELSARPRRQVDVVGPICETGDFLALDRELPEPRVGDLLAIAHAGAYGMAMASQYNSRPRAAEVLVEEDGSARVIRRRETVEDILAAELP